MTQTQAPTNRDRFAASLRSLADAIGAGLTPDPTSADIWLHNLSMGEFLAFADNIGAPITVREATKGGGAAHAVVGYQPARDLLAPGKTITVYASTFVMDEAARAAYAAHNTECVVTD